MRRSFFAIWELIRSYPRASATVVSAWILDEVVKPRVAPWLANRFDQESGALSRMLLMVVWIAVTHPIEFGGIVLIIYLSGLLLKAQLIVSLHKRTVGRRTGGR